MVAFEKFSEEDKQIANLIVAAVSNNWLIIPSESISKHSSDYGKKRNAIYFFKVDASPKNPNHIEDIQDIKISSAKGFMVSTTNGKIYADQIRLGYTMICMSAGLKPSQYLADYDNGVKPLSSVGHSIAFDTLLEMVGRDDLKAIDIANTNRWRIFLNDDKMKEESGLSSELIDETVQKMGDLYAQAFDVIGKNISKKESEKNI